MSIQSYLSELADVVFPRWCPGCGAWDTFLCSECANEFARPWRDVSPATPYIQHVLSPADNDVRSISAIDTEPRFPIFAVAPYAHPAQAVVVNWKNTVNRGLSAGLAHIFESRCSELAATYFRGEAPGGAGQSIAVVPAPSRFRRIHDGRFVAGTLAQASVKGFARAGVDSRYCNILRTGRGRGDGLLAARKAKSRAIRVKGGSQAPKNVVLIDDVVTTGATLVGAADAIEREGGKVLCACVLLAAPDPRKHVVNIPQFGNVNRLPQTIEVR